MSTLRESDFLRGGGTGGRDELGPLGLRAKEEEEEFETDFNEPYDALRGGNGGAEGLSLGGEDSR